MTTEERIAHIDAALEGLRHGWAFAAFEVESRIETLIEQLINNDNERTRGAIHELRRLMDLPESLRLEREAFSAALAEQAAAD